jgi:hypothetical protein
MDEAWIAQQIAEIKQMPYYTDPQETTEEEALLECASCVGRKFGCCSHQCRYWEFTASLAERQAVDLAGATDKPHVTRGWLGSTQPEGFEAKGSDAA